MHKIKRLFVLVLAVALFAAMAICVSAADEQAKIGDTPYATLQEAIDAASENDKIVLLKDVNIVIAADASSGYGIVVGANKKLTLDLAGYKLSYVTYKNTTTAGIYNSGDLTIMDSSASGSGIITNESVSPDTQDIPGYASNTIVNCGKLTINGGTVENVTVGGGAAYAIDTSYYTQNTSITVNGGRIKAKSTAIRIVGYSETATNTLTVTGGDISSEAGYAVQVMLMGSGNPVDNAYKANVDISGGTFAGGSGYAFYSYSFGPNMKNIVSEISGGTFDGHVAFSGGKNKENAETVKVTGGDFKDGFYSFAADDVAKETITVKGGTFGALSEAYLGAGNELVEINGVLTVLPCNHVGVATCQALAVCTVCGDTFGELDYSNHTGTSTLMHDESKHYLHWNCCNTESDSKPHNYMSSVCSVCGVSCTHKGGTATCQAPANCEACGVAYGEKNPAVHAERAVCQYDDDEGHIKVYPCCNITAASKMPHNFVSGVCACGYECKHEGGKATCTAKAVCTKCGTAYGEVDANAHTGTANWAVSGDKHSKVYDCCNAVALEETVHTYTDGKCECGAVCAHSGGKATCTARAICEVCKNEYGEVSVAYHTGDVEWIFEDNTHKLVYSCCGHQVASESEHIYIGGECRCGATSTDDAPSTPKDEGGIETDALICIIVAAISTVAVAVVLVILFKKKR